MDDRTGSAGLRTRLRLAALAGWTLFGLAYLTIFSLFGSAQSGVGWQRALINTVPAALLSFPMAKAIETWLVDARWPLAMVGHLALALLFSVLWYIGIQVGYGLQNGWVESGITGRPLLGLAIIWQSFQSVTLYAAIAGFAYAATYRLRLAALGAELANYAKKPETPPAAPRQVLVKDGRNLKPVAIDDILALSGAGDYVEVHTRDGMHLSSTTLSEFASELPSGFARVHRSHIVRMDAVLEIESAGNGRLTLHLPKGLSVTTSRAGAQIVRERAV